MIILLSAFNGIESLVDGLYNKFDPDITISAKTGKVLYDDSVSLELIKEIKGVSYITSALTETAIVTKGLNRKSLCEIMGVDTVFTKAMSFKDDVPYGVFNLHHGETDYVIPGVGIASDLGLALRNGESENLKIYAPIRGKKISRAREKAFSEKLVSVSGAFTINAELDLKYVVTSLDLAREIFNYPGQSSFVGIEVDEAYDNKNIKSKIEDSISGNYIVRTRQEKNPLLYETNASEKRATFLILFFVLIIAIFNGMASLTMLVLEKRRDINVLKSMGASWPFIKRIFMLEGILINLTGVVLGIILGLFVCWLQQTFGLLPIEGTIVEYYPLKVEILDLLIISVAVIVTGVLASVLMVNYLVNKLKKA